ncbi:hypothetical protein [Butyrivibrio sp. XPD2002]|uniref:hypothetical protein n=1 Tax=Butyrivibrio sp. XPD2002 TaxID=1280665 RepID=UPI000405BEA2|nr:hypothetical protein [Butyrivibrio sp. XPD2002]
MKQLIKCVIGEKNTKRIKKAIQSKKYFDDIKKGTVGKIITELEHRVYAVDGYHLFFGYYDIQQGNADNSKLLVHKLKKGAISGIDEITISYIDKRNGEIKDVATSKAWNWQQGSRLRWNPLEEDCIFFNNTANGNYCTELWDMNEKKLIHRYNRAFYDISPGADYGLSLNFARLQRLRPGYGYSNFVDLTQNEVAPVDDGIFFEDMATGETRCLINLRELSLENHVGDEYESYVNHISISPNGSGFIFFYVWTKGKNMLWKNALYYYDFKSKNRRLITREIVTSHYCWIDESNLIFTSTDGKYYICNVESNARILENPKLVRDGHPSYIKGGNVIISDTYPLKGDYQHIFMADIYDSEYCELVCVFSDPRMYGEYRCDTHPRITRDRTLMTIDSTYKGEMERSVIEFDISSVHLGTNTSVRDGII